MQMGEIVVWLLTIVFCAMTLVLYIRVDIHDWGMVGFTVLLFGCSVLLVRAVLHMYGVIDTEQEMLMLWRLLVLIGGPVALAGYVMGLWRDPPPARQVITRLVVLALVTAVMALVFAST